MCIYACVCSLITDSSYVNFYLEFFYSSFKLLILEKKYKENERKKYLLKIISKVIINKISVY